MRRPVRTRITACFVAAAATTAVGIALAPAAQAGGPEIGPATGGTVLQHLRENTSSNVPNILTDVPPFGRKLS